MSAMANVTERTVTWNNVNWRKVHAQVRNLRQRIFRATREGNLKKVRNLQKLMLRSRSNILASTRRVTQINIGRHTAINKSTLTTSRVKEKNKYPTKSNKSLWKLYDLLKPCVWKPYTHGF